MGRMIEVDESYIEDLKWKLEQPVDGLTMMVVIFV